MITIDQLLKSVDLDFEPRWVTKDEDGQITIFSHRPIPEDWCEEWREDEGDYETFGVLKLSEFENKHWTECLYEIPQKTTEKIKKLKTITDPADIDLSVGAVNRIWGDTPLILKINELVDAVNELKGRIDGQ